MPQIKNHRTAEWEGTSLTLCGVQENQLKYQSKLANSTSYKLPEMQNSQPPEAKRSAAIQTLTVPKVFPLSFNQI